MASKSWQTEELVGQLFNVAQIYKTQATLLAKDMQERMPAIEKLKELTSYEQAYKLIQNSPREMQEDLKDKFKKHFEYVEKIYKFHKDYFTLYEKMGKFLEFAQNSRPDAVQEYLRKEYGKDFKKPENIAKMYNQMIKKYSTDWHRIVKKLTQIDREINSTMYHFGKYKNQEASHAANLVAIVISVGFAGLTLYALSQINPENVTVGAFFAGSNSSVLLTMLSAVVIFLLFFLTHHKLK